ncbi:MAG: glycosyltransferase [Deltaproteobacteria bacterium]|nr:glycosyltransferase [Deltaproteobacteria bacterium]MCL5277522.1 glycosyltransferase [Deltaproteobacteria bacterium]
MESTENKIKVLRIIARLNIGGPAIHTILLTRYLGGRFETRLVAGEVSEGEESMDYLLERLGVVPVHVNTLRRELSFFRDLRSVLRIYGLIREFRPDIVHTHTAKAGAIGRAAGILYNLLHLRHGKSRIRLVHSFHGHVFRGYFNRPVSSLFAMTERALAAFTDAIIAVSGSLKRDLVETYRIAPDGKIKVVYNGYDLDAFLKIDPADGPPAGRETTITTVGRLVPIKGQAFLIKAFSMLKARARLLIAGDGVSKAELVRLSKDLGVSERVCFLGYTKDMASVYRETDIFVLSSLNEGAPVAVIEALASARPVIATDVGGIADLLGIRLGRIADDVYLCERGILVPPAREDSIAAAIEYLINNPGIGYTTGAQGRRFTGGFFTIDRLMEDMDKLYTGVMER